MTASITNQADTLTWGLDSINVYPNGAWDVTRGNPGSYMLISTGHLRGHLDLPNVPVNNCGGFFGGCDDGPFGTFSGTFYLGAALGPLNAFGWVGVAP
ncbi:MAG: hypothetical protein ACE5HT_16130 [Gemmatimonadales bacterium]